LLKKATVGLFLHFISDKLDKIFGKLVLPIAN